MISNTNPPLTVFMGVLFYTATLIVSFKVNPSVVFPVTIVAIFLFKLSLNAPSAEFEVSKFPL